MADLKNSLAESTNDIISVIERWERRFSTHTTLETFLSKTLGYISPSLPTYNGSGSDDYINWEIDVDNYFSQRKLCDKRKIRTAASSLTSFGSTWWKDLCAYNKVPQTWKDMKRLMRDEFVVPCDKEELCDNSLIIPIPQLSNQHDTFKLESKISAMNKYIIPICSLNEEIRLLSSLNTLGYIEFGILCNLNNLEEKLSMNFDFPWLSRNTYHVIGRYNCSGDYMIHRVYICSNLKSSFVVQQCDQLEGYNNAKFVVSSSSNFVLNKYDNLQEGEYYSLLIPSSTIISHTSRKKICLLLG